MDIKVMSQSSNKLDLLSFDSASTSPYVSAPSSPHRRFAADFYYSAPTSPTNRLASAFYTDDAGGEDDDGASSVASSSVPFVWEEKPGLPKSSVSSTYGDAAEEEELNNDGDDFAFDFSGQFETASLHADELFDGGKIRPLKPPPRFDFSTSSSKPPPPPPESPRSSPRKIIQGAILRRKNNGYDFDPFQTAMDIQTRKEQKATIATSSAENRGKSSVKGAADAKQRKNNVGGARSLSPLRVSDLLLEPEEKPDPNPSSSSSLFPSFFYKKWKIKDLLLFRSASESRATELRKAAAADVKNSSFRSMDGSVGSGSSRRRAGRRISAHELHYYSMGRGVSEEMKKRTFLPYKQLGVLGCLGFVPSVPNMPR